MKTYLWSVGFDNGESVCVSASTVLVATKNAVWGYNKDRNPSMKPKNIISIIKL